jgi:hypothetical protein
MELIMILDIKIHKMREMRCHEKILSTIAACLGRRYEMMFSQFWKFNLLDLEISPQLIGNRIEIDNDDFVQLFEYYHGIKIEENDEIKPNNVVKNIKVEIEKGLPIYTNIKGKYVHWTYPNEKEIDIPFLIVGIDEPQNLIHCLDVHYLNKVSDIPLNDFLKGMSGFYIAKVFKDEEKYISWKEIMANNLNYLNKNYSFNKMKKLSEILYSTNNYKISTRKDPIGDYELIEKIQEIFRSRYLFSYTINYLLKYHEAVELSVFPEKFIKLSDKWLTIWNVLNKSIYIKDFEFKKSSISKRIYEMAEEEEKIYDELLNAVNSNSLKMYNKNSSKIIEKNDPIKIIKNIKKFHIVDISSYFNNEGFSSSFDTNVTADLTGTGEFFLTEGLPKEEFWNIQNIEFSASKIKKIFVDFYSINVYI